MNQPHSQVPPGRKTTKHAFSLVEVLVVMGIIAILVAMLAPAVSGFSNTAGRRGAVNVVMNTIDQARVAALEQGRNVHVVMARRGFPEQDSLIVLREVNPDEFEQLTRWISLPKGILFQNERGIFSMVDDPRRPSLDSHLPLLGNKINYGVLTFNGSGAVDFPNGAEANSRRIHLIEGVREGSAETPRVDGVEVISVARYTGRPQLDVSFQNF